MDCIPEGGGDLSSLPKNDSRCGDGERETSLDKDRLELRNRDLLEETGERLEL